MRLRKVKLMLSGIVILSSILTPIPAKAYNAGGDGYIRMNSWDVSNFNSSVNLWSQTRANYDATKVSDRITTGDYNGDGKDEVAAFYDYGSGQTKIHMFSNSNGTLVDSTPYDSLIGNFDALSISGKVVSGDFNGDGIDEILTLYNYGNSGAKLFKFSYNNSTKKFTYDVVWSATSFNWNSVKGMVSGDYNGDGKDEVLMFYDYGNRYTGMFELKMGSDGKFTDRYAWESLTFDANATKGKIVAGDFDGDKRDEVAMFYDYGNGTTKIWSLKNTNNVYSASETFDAPSFDASKITGKVVSTRYGNGKKDKIIALYDYSYLNNETGLFTWELGTNNKFTGTKQKQLTNYEADRVTGRVFAGKFDGQTMRLGAMYDGTYVNPIEDKQQKVISEAYKHLGKPYVYGATGPSSFDCSGLTSYVYRHALGIEIGRTTHDQIKSGTVVSSISQLKPGDLIFPKSDISHVALYIGNGKMIHAPQPGRNVEISDIYAFYTARRIIN